MAGFSENITAAFPAARLLPAVLAGFCARSRHSMLGGSRGPLPEMCLKSRGGILRLSGACQKKKEKAPSRSTAANSTLKTLSRRRLASAVSNCTHHSRFDRYAPKAEARRRFARCIPAAGETGARKSATQVCSSSVETICKVDGCTPAEFSFSLQGYQTHEKTIFS